MGARPNNFISQTDFYETAPCKFCGDDARRVVCSADSCDHAFCSKERGVCYECGIEKLGAIVQYHSKPSIKGFKIREDDEYYKGDDAFDLAVRLIEDNG